MLIKSIREITPEPSRCISVDSPDKLFAVGDSTSPLLTHNSVAQRNIIISCLLRPDNWVLLGIDLKRVELSPYREFGVSVATEIGTALDFLRFAQAVMMKRYEDLEAIGKNNFMELDNPGQALLVMIDEAGELLSPSGAKALIGSTKVPTKEGEKLLKDIEIGEVIYDNYNNPTKVVNKYTPVNQRRYKVSISNDSTGEAEDFIAGEEHFWAVYTKGREGVISGPFTWTTEELSAFMKREALLPEGERTQLKIKKGGSPTSEGIH